VKGAEKVLYGLDDVKGAAEIIIVEGEMDKLALEEAGLTNVLSVPDGAPREVRPGEVPPPGEDTKFGYLWNCRAVLDQALRIVLATDGDAPGQVRRPARLGARTRTDRLQLRDRACDCCRGLCSPPTATRSARLGNVQAKLSNVRHCVRAAASCLTLCLSRMSTYPPVACSI
jgi:hypothetical protein